MIDVARLDALKARADALWRDDFGLPTGYQNYIEYHNARHGFENELAAQWPAIRAVLMPDNDQHLMMNDIERIPSHERSTDRTSAAAEKTAA